MEKLPHATLPSELYLRAPERKTPFHVVLVEPEIPPNTGNVARLCGATCAALHLVGKLGFRIDEHAVRRAGLDYWHLVDVRVHADFDAAKQAIRQEEAQRGNQPQFWLFTGHAPRSYLEATYRVGDALVFGCESVGLPRPLVAAHAESALGIPMLGEVRSHNLANSAAIALYEGLRQIGALDACALR